MAVRWGMTKRPMIAGGAGDNPAGAIGIGAIRPAAAFVSLGTSGALLAPTNATAANPQRAVHTFCHAIPAMWIQAGAILSAASSLAWIARLLRTSEADLLEPLGLRPTAPSHVNFLPYLSGERTPHDDPEARGMLDGLNHGTDRAAIVQAVLEGVAFAIADCRDALADTGIVISEAAIGGGSRSRFWLSVLANVLNIPIHRFADGETGAAFGAARLGRLAVTGEAVEAVCTPLGASRPSSLNTHSQMLTPSGFPNGASCIGRALTPPWTLERDDIGSGWRARTICRHPEVHALARVEG